MICEFCDVVVVPFPFVDPPTAKKRPALVLSNHEFNRRNAHSVLAMITTAAQSSWPSDHLIADLAKAGLSHRSVVRMKVFTLPNAMIIRRIGGLADIDRSSIRAMVGRTFASDAVGDG